jgi:hypothetical protein
MIKRKLNSKLSKNKFASTKSPLSRKISGLISIFKFSKQNPANPNKANINLSKNYFYKPKKTNFSKPKVVVKAPSVVSIIKAKITNIDLMKEKNLEQKNLSFINIFSYWKRLPTLISKLNQFFLASKNKNYKEKLRLLFNLIFRVSSMVVFTRIILSLIVFSSILSLIYLSFFNVSFVVKHWEIDFPKSSYLDKSSSQKLIQSFENERQFNLLPLSSYWFINDYNLTAIAKRDYNFIEKVEITKREFPNKVGIRITTMPVLATLAVMVNNTNYQYWRISQNGEVLAKDEYNIYENLIYVEKLMSFDRSNVTFKDTSIFLEDKKQLDRLYFIYTVKNILTELKHKVERVSIESLNTADYQVNFRLDNGAILMFDSSQFDKATTIRRINEISRTNIFDEIEQDKIRYIDLRLPKKIYICYKFLEC